MHLKTFEHPRIPFVSENPFVAAKNSKFSQKGVFFFFFYLKWDPCEQQERREKGIFISGPHIPIPPC